MALVIFPLLNYDSFISLADAEIYIANNIPTSNKTGWTAIEENADKEIFLRQSTTLIKQKITLPAENNSDIQAATCYLAVESVGKDMTNEDGSEFVKKKRYEGYMETEYFHPKADSSNDFSDIVEGFLKEYYATSDGSFTFGRG